MSAPVNYADLYAGIIAEAGTGREVFPKGRYLVRLVKVSPGVTKGGKLSVGLMWACIDPASPLNPKTTWTNIYLTPREENEIAFGIYVRTVVSLGIPQAVLAAGTPPEKLHEHIPVGLTGTASLDSSPFNDEPRQELKGFSATVVGGAPVKASAPAVAAPVAVAVPVPVPAPIVQRQDGPNIPAAPIDVVASLKAQLAALEAQAVPAAVKEPF